MQTNQSEPSTPTPTPRPATPFRQAVIVAVDALSLTYLGCYGSEWVDTPNLDRLAMSQFLFDHCFASEPRRGQLLASALTGTRHQRSAERLAQSHPNHLLPHRLQARGVNCTILSNHTDFSQQTDRPWVSAFQEAEHFVEPEPPHWQEIPETELAEALQFRLPVADRRGEPQFVPWWTDADWAKVVSADDVNDAWLHRYRRHLARQRELGEERPRSLETLFASATLWLQEVRHQSALLWLDASIQSEWLPPAEYLERYLDPEDPPPLVDPFPCLLGQEFQRDDLEALRLGQAARISYLDALIGAFLEAVEQAELGEFLLIMTAEQGMPFGEHQSLGSFRPWLYEERVHLPLLVQYPQGRKAARSPALVQPMDLYATLEDFFQLRPILPAWDQGLTRNLTPLLRGQLQTPRDYVCASVGEEEHMIQTHQWKLILPTSLPLPTEPPRDRALFVKPEDRFDMNNVVEQYTDPADLLELQLWRYLNAVRQGQLDRLPPLPLDRLAMRS